MQKQDIDVVCAQLAAEAIEIGAHFLFGGGARLGEDGDFVAGHAFEGLFHVRVSAVLVGGIPETHAIIVGGVEKIGEAAEAELARLVGTATHAVGAGTLSQAAQLDLHGSEVDAVGGTFRGRAGKEVMGETVERDRGARNCGGAGQEVTAIHVVLLLGKLAQLEEGVRC